MNQNPAVLANFVQLKDMMAVWKQPKYLMIVSVWTTQLHKDGKVQKNIDFL